MQSRAGTMHRFECAAILFDLDGVLVDSRAHVEEQWRRWAAARGLRAEPFLAFCHGRRAVETIRLAAPDLDAEAEAAALLPEEPAHGSIGPIEGAGRLLEQLPIGSWAVATSGTRTMATGRLLRAGLPVPRVLVCAEDVVHGKPHPEVYLKAARGLGVPPAECLVIEDAPAGVEAAQAAGMSVLGLTTTHRRAELPAAVWAPSLAAVHLGRVGRREGAGCWLEVLVLEP